MGGNRPAFLAIVTFFAMTFFLIGKFGRSFIPNKEVK